MCFVFEFSLSTLASTSVHHVNKAKPAFAWLKLKQSYYIKLSSFHCFLWFSDLWFASSYSYSSPTQPSCLQCTNSACPNNPCLVRFSM